MSDDALIAWLNSGAKVELAADDATARRRAAFSSRFAHALKTEDAGPTQEMHDAAIARLVFAVHSELNALGETEYSAVWQTLGSKERAAIKAYIDLAKRGH